LSGKSINLTTTKNKVMKKKNLLLSLVIATGISAFAQQSSSVQQIPANVSAKFQALYPNVTNVTWEQQQSYFIPVFTINNVPTKLLIDAKGKMVQTSSKIAATSLPASANRYITSNYRGQMITDAEKLTMLNNSTRYEAIVGGHDLIFDANGNFMKIATGPLKQ
jgi:hypothetical protein